MKIVVGSDAPQHHVFRGVVEDLVAAGHDVTEVEPGDWVDVGHRVGHAVAARRARLGVVCCHTGTGVALAASKVDGVRAALCASPAVAEGSRLYNHANVLALALGFTGPHDAIEITRTWLRTPTGAGEHRDAVARVELTGADGARPDLARPRRR